MIADIILTDDDQGREYHLDAECRVRREIGGRRGYCCDLEGVFLREAVVYFGEQKIKVALNADESLRAELWIERKYQQEIESLCIEAFEKQRSAA